MYPAKPPIYIQGDRQCIACTFRKDENVDNVADIRKRKTGNPDVVEAVSDSIMSLAGHLAKYVTVLQRVESGLASRNKQRA